MSMTETMSQTDRKRILREAVAKRNKAIRALKEALKEERAAYKEHLNEIEGWPNWLWEAEEQNEILTEDLAEW